MFGYIYKTTNEVNGKIYVGQHKWSGDSIDTSYIGSGKRLLDAVKCYGIENFSCEILEWCQSESDMNQLEVYYISYYNSTDPEYGYNLSDGGPVPRLSGIHNGFYGKQHSEETRKHLSQNNARYMLGKHHSEETKQKMSEALKGRIVTQETRDKLSYNASINPNYGMRGKNTSNDTKQKIAAKALDRWSDSKVREEQSIRVMKLWEDKDYRDKHVQAMRGKSHRVPKTECPYCGRLISNSNYSRHEPRCKLENQIQQGGD